MSINDHSDSRWTLDGSCSAVRLGRTPDGHPGRVFVRKFRILGGFEHRLSENWPIGSHGCDSKRVSSRGGSGRVAAVMARIATLLGADAMRVVAKIMKVVNPVPRFLARGTKHMAVIEHIGRKSGKSYRTPVMAFVEDDTLSVVLNYGADSDWVRNIQAAGSAIVEHRGKRYKLENPRVLSIDSPAFPASVRAIQKFTETALHGTLSAV